jgi:hypothetical protein
MDRCVSILIAAIFLTAGAVPGPAASQKQLANERTVGKIEAVAFFYGPMPTGVTVSHGGRMFVNFPQWGDKVAYTVAEVKKGKTAPYPNAKINTCEKGNQKDCFVAVQSVVVDPKDRLRVLGRGEYPVRPDHVWGTENGRHRSQDQPGV